MSEQSTVTSTSAQDQVEYRDILGWPGYQAGSDGSIWSFHKLCRGGLTASRHRLKPIENTSTGRLLVNLYKERHLQKFFVSRLVLLAFVGLCPEGQECCHEDGDYLNNAVGNLKWGTKVSNERDKKRHGTHPRGSQSVYAKLTEEVVCKLREEHALGGISYKKLADRHKVHPVTVRNAIRRITWAHV